MEAGGAHPMSADRRSAALVLLGPALGLIAFLAAPVQYSGAGGELLALDLAARAVIGILVWMASWWLSEAVPLPVTSLLPALLFPLVGIADAATAMAPYADPLIFMFLGGFLLSTAVQKWDLHRMFAYRLVSLTGHSPARLVAGIMLATAFISMWISNTATAVLMLPVALSIADRSDVDDDLRKCLLLGVAYSATIGGMGTLIGTPPNLFVASFLAQHHDVQIDFLHWLGIGMPVVLLVLPGTWLLLTRWCFPLHATPGISDDNARFSTAPLGPAGRRTLLVFSMAATCWICRVLLVKLELGGVRPFAGLTDTGIAIAAALVLFLLPAGRSRPGATLLAWEDAKAVPWGTLILFGGGLSLAAAISATGVDRAVGSLVAGLPAMPTWVVIAVIATTVVFVSEVASNIATAAAMTPLLVAAGPALGLTPTACAVVTGLAASSAYMMPVGTAANALVYGTGAVSTRDMMRAGFLLNVVSIALITAVGVWLLPLVLP
jgi:sodium-dependent dicarboxylate transporter 2/3/5